jgi:hypothetical protein
MEGQAQTVQTQRQSPELLLSVFADEQIDQFSAVSQPITDHHHAAPFDFHEDPGVRQDPAASYQGPSCLSTTSCDKLPATTY